MQLSVFVIGGYGVPTDIMTDQNYQRYLGFCFNQIFDYSQSHPGLLTVILTGGPTDLQPPYRRTEAGEMKRWFLLQLRTLPLIERRRWHFIVLAKGLSALENILAVQQQLGKKIPTTIFCEYTRRWRLSRLAKAIFSRPIVVTGVDFDLSPRRYIPGKDIIKKEQVELKRELSIRRDVQMLKMYRQEKTDRLAQLRQTTPKQRPLLFVREYYQRPAVKR